MKVGLALGALFLALAASAGAAGGGYGPPAGLHAFLLTPSEAPQAYYPRTPAFAWSPEPVHGGTYDFQLSTSRSFTDSTVLFSYSHVRIPAIAVDHQLPWMTGSPDALWAHVRWHAPNGTITHWSSPFGFNMRWRDQDTPQQLPAPVGLVRWKPVEGATRYEVLYTDIHPSSSFQTTTNVADEREYFTLHEQLGWGATIHWRVRAIRYIDDKDLLRNGLPRASYGPWSPTFTTVNPGRSVGQLTPLTSLSDNWGNGAHQLTPGFSWTPSAPAVTQVPAFGSSLYRVYVFTDNHCVNQVFAGSIVGSPAFAPRTVGGPLALPQDTKGLATWNSGFVKNGGPEGTALDPTGRQVSPNEQPGAAAGSSSSSGGSSSSSTTSPTGAVPDASVDLWDSGWPTGRYYWTVVPVTVELNGDPDPTKPGASQSIVYQDAAVPQDQCETGHVMSFGKVSQPVVTSSATPFVSGLAPDGRVVASAAKVPTLHDSPLIAWEPAVGATSYQVQLSRAKYPWKVTWDHVTPATSIVLPLSAKNVGTWFYRVRGINPALPVGAQRMTWSRPVQLRISGDRFHIAK